MFRVDSFLVKLNRYVAYALIPLTLLMLVTGFRMTGSFGFFSRGFSDLLHRVYLTMGFVVLFTVHVLLSVRTVLMRKRIRSRLLDVLFITAGAGLVGYFTVLSLRLVIFFP